MMLYSCLYILFLILLAIQGKTVTLVEEVQVLVAPNSHPEISKSHESTPVSPSTSSYTSESEKESLTSASVESDVMIDAHEFEGLINQTFAWLTLTQHNSKRALHGSQNLEWNNTLLDYAANFASQYDCSGQLKHSGGPYGENLAIGYTTVGSINAWYAEGDNYQYGTESTYNHFTAMIWNSSSSLACAFKYCGSVWGTYIVCSYYPEGNIIGQSAQNVLPLK